LRKKDEQEAFPGIEHMHAALDMNMPNYAVAIVTTNELAGSINEQTNSSRF
jgi:hypothetical protein